MGDELYLTAAGVYAKADCMTEVKAEVAGKVSSVIGVDDFVLQTSGWMSGLSSLNAGSVYFLGTAGGSMGTAAPTNEGYVDKPVFLADSGTSGFVLQMRGVVITASAVSDTAFGTSWNGETETAPSKNAVYDQMELRAPKTNPTFAGVVHAINTDIYSNRIEINKNGSGNRYAYLDLFGDDVNTNYAFRLIRYNSGENAVSALIHEGTGDLMLYTTDAAPIVFKTATTARLQITAAGVIEALSGQIKFPATQNASSDVNTLDDYEEGTWTPDFAVTDYAWSTAPSSVTAYYTKIGRLVIVFIIGSGGVCEAYDRIGGLPFACGAAGTILLVSLAVQNVVSPGLMEPASTEIKNLAAFSPAGWWHTIGFYLT